MNLKYQITLDDYWEYYRKESNDFYNNIWLRSLSSIIIAFCFIFGIYILYAAFSRYLNRIDYLIWSIFTGCLSLGAGIAFLFIFNPELRARSRYKQFKKILNEDKKPSLLAERNIIVNKNGLSLEAETFLHIFVDWDLFARFSETDNLLILHFHCKELQLIPKRCFENYEEIEQFRELLENKAENLDDRSVFTEKIAEKDGILNLEYQLEAKDYLEAEQAKKIYDRWFIWYYPISITFFLGLGFYDFWEAIYDFDLLLGDRTKINYLINGFLFLGLGFNMLLTQYPKINIFQRRKIAKKWDNNKPMQAARKLIVTENEIILMTDYFVEAIALQEYLKYSENKEICLLYYSEKDYQIVPKKAFKEEEMNQFRELIQSQNQIMKMSF
ncbi:MAG: YcxB family protein [Prochloraceae cyanobacterium]|nr:YcxB family protein [Prochloraceae cyanobacterium]